MPLPSLELQTCLFGYPLKKGSYAFMSAEAVILILIALDVLSDFIRGIPVSPLVLIVFIITSCMVIPTGLGLYGIKEERNSYILAYIGAQAFYVFLLVIWIIYSLMTVHWLESLFPVLFFVFSWYTLQVVYSYFQQLAQLTSLTLP